jgi:hypothetical protein
MADTSMTGIPDSRAIRMSSWASMLAMSAPVLSLQAPASRPDIWSSVDSRVGATPADGQVQILHGSLQHRVALVLNSSQGQSVGPIAAREEQSHRWCLCHSWGTPHGRICDGTDDAPIVAPRLPGSFEHSPGRGQRRLPCRRFYYPMRHARWT